MTVSSRMYRDEADYGRIRALLVEMLRLQGPPVDCTAGDLDSWRFAWGESPADIETARLWEDDSGRVVAVAWFGYALVDQFVHPAHRDLEDEMLAWAEAQRAAEERKEDTEHVLAAFAFDGDPVRRAVFERREYVRTESAILRFRRMLDDDPPAALPPGYRVRNLRDATDLEQRVDLHRAAFGSKKLSVAKYRVIQTAPGYRLDQDFVAEASDGSLAAFTIVWVDEANRTVVFEPVGCHPDHRRRGLARALILEVCHRMRSRGVEQALVGAGDANEAAKALYRSAGFGAQDRLREWRKSL